MGLDKFHRISLKTIHNKKIHSQKMSPKKKKT